MGDDALFGALRRPLTVLILRGGYHVVVGRLMDSTDRTNHQAKSAASQRKRNPEETVNNFVAGAGEQRESRLSRDREGVPQFLCRRRVTSDDVKALEDEI